MKKFISSLLILTAAFGMTGCEDFLQVNPKQVLDENLLVKPAMRPSSPPSSAATPRSGTARAPQAGLAAP